MPSRTTATPYERVGELEALIQQAVDIQVRLLALLKAPRLPVTD